MRRAEVYRNRELAGVLTEQDDGQFQFRYAETYYQDTTKSAISLTLPKSQQVYTSDSLFPFFANMLTEGMNRIKQSRLLKIDENDSFGILLATALYDTIGAVTVKPIAP